jgi:hypothetical protein
MLYHNGAFRDLDAQCAEAYPRLAKRLFTPRKRNPRWPKSVVEGRSGSNGSEAKALAGTANLHRKPSTTIRCRDAARVEIGCDRTARRAASLDAGGRKA